MPTILKKFKEKFEHLLSPEADDKKIDFENQTVTLDDQDYLFCRAVVSSIPEMLSVERAVYNGKTPINYAVFEKQIQDVANQLVLLVRFEDRVVAYVACNYAHGEARITDIAIVPRFQRRGIATKMLKFVIAEAQKLRCRRVSLDVRQSNLQGQKFYGDLGFKKERIKHHYFSDNDENAYEYGYLLKGEK